MTWRRPTPPGQDSLGSESAGSGGKQRPRQGREARGASRAQRACAPGTRRTRAIRVRRDRGANTIPPDSGREARRPTVEGGEINEPNYLRANF